AQGRIVTRDWDLFDTRHVVYRPRGLSASELKRGYDWAYEAFYRWGSIVRAATAHASMKHRVKHAVYSAGWKKFERAWNAVIRLRQLSRMRPLLEASLSPAGRGRRPSAGAWRPGLPSPRVPPAPAFPLLPDTAAWPRGPSSAQSTVLAPKPGCASAGD